MRVRMGNNTDAIACTEPALHISEVDGRIRLGLEGMGYVEGATLQEAANELIAHVLQVAKAIRATGVAPARSESCPDPEFLGFLWRLGEHAEAGGDPRELLFGPNRLAE